MEFYRRLARESGGPVLELGCGTGRVLLPIAADGIACTGLDPSEAMLEELRRKRPPRNLRLVSGRMQDFDLAPERFALVFSAFRAFQHLLSVEDQLACLRARAAASRARRALRLRRLRAEARAGRASGRAGIRGGALAGRGDRDRPLHHRAARSGDPGLGDHVPVRAAPARIAAAEPRGSNPDAPLLPLRDRAPARPSPVSPTSRSSAASTAGPTTTSPARPSSSRGEPGNHRPSYGLRRAGRRRFRRRRGSTETNPFAVKKAVLIRERSPGLTMTCW